MDKELVRIYIERLKDELKGIDVFSREFFFGTAYADRRSQIAFLAPSINRRSTLSILIREGMNDEARIRLFPSVYQLGNMAIIPKENCTYEKLVDELYGENRGSVDPKDAFESIEKGIYRFTNKKIKDHSKIDKSKTLKVLHTLHTLMSSGRSSLMNLLLNPKVDSKFSMSFRDAYPYELNKEQVWFISDLKSYFSAELSDSRFEEITVLHDKFFEWTIAISTALEKTILTKCSKNLDTIIIEINNLIAIVNDFEFPCASNEAQLDEIMFSHLSKLENLHFFTGLIQVFKISIPDIKVNSAWKETSVFVNSIFPVYNYKTNENLNFILIRAIPSFTLKHQSSIQRIIEVALGKKITESKILSLSNKAMNLLKNLNLFRVNGLINSISGESKVSALELIAAFCCILQTESENLNYKPYWHGQKNQSGSLKTSNISPVDYRFNSFEKISEEHLQIWRYRQEWFLFALRDQAELISSLFDLRAAIATVAIEIYKNNNTDCIQQAKDSFEKYINSYLIRKNLTPFTFYN